MSTPKRNDLAESISAESSRSYLPRFKSPPPADSKSIYNIRISSKPDDIRAAQALRFQVFNLELNEGLQESFNNGLDADAFDSVCEHLLVEDQLTGSVVGTYRLQTGLQAQENLGYYSAQEFEFLPFENFRSHMVELGRACVHRQHRNLTVLQMLWRGIANYAKEHQARYLIGCSSLTSQDPLVGAQAYDQLKACLAPSPWRTSPVPQCACPLEHSAATPVKIPKLLTAYLSLGAKICGPPAIDREFKTIDFLTFLDLQSLAPKIMFKYFS